jgi:hypothetical protein
MAELILGVELDTAASETALKKRLTTVGKDAGQNFGASFSSSLLDIARISTGAGLGQLGADLVRSAVSSIKNVARESVAEFVESEQATKILTAALEGTRAGSMQALRSIQMLADELEVLAGIDDKVILKNAALIQSLANLDSQGLQRAIRGAADLAAGMQISFDQASDIIARVASGGVEPFNKAFRKYGITIDETIPKSQALARALEIISTQFDGRAQKNLTDYDKSINDLTSSYEDLQKAIGKTITESDAVKTSISTTADVIKLVKGTIENPSKGLGAIFGVLTDQISLKSAREQLEKINQEVINLATNANAIPAGKIPTGPSKEETAASLSKLGNIGLDQTQIANAQFQQDMKKLQQEQEFIGQQEFNARMQTLEQQHQATLAGIKGTSQFEQANAERLDQDKRAARAQAINSAISQTLAKSAAMGVEALTKSLVLGEKGFENFGKSIAGMLGDMATQLGMTLLMSGMGIDALHSLGGAAAIAAGAGLIAFGTIMKSFSGGGGGSDAGAAIGGPNSFTPAATNDLLDQQRIEPETKVSVNIMGDVFDSEETGLRISKIIKDASLNNNIKIFGAI